MEVDGSGDMLESIDLYKLADIVEDEVQSLVDNYRNKLINKRTKINDKYVYYLSERLFCAINDIQ